MVHRTDKDRSELSWLGEDRVGLGKIDLGVDFVEISSSRFGNDGT